MVMGWVGLEIQRSVISGLDPACLSGHSAGMECPSEWNEAGENLQRLTQGMMHRALPYLPRLAPKVQSGFGPLVIFLFAEDRRLRADLDLACKRSGHETAHLLRLSPSMAYFLFLRCQCANDFVGQLFPPASREDPFGSLPQGWDVTRLQGWLLTELWNRRSDHWLKLVANELVGPFPFYGIEDAPEFG
jgi:hypothetical protein